jgi:serine palmitoyltransferase
LRLIIDESLSIGALGRTGRGLCELYDVPANLIEIRIGSYGTSFASLGGFTVATKELCGHQRLASHAYIFSASPPCFNCVAASKAIEIAERSGESRMSKLAENVAIARNAVKGIHGFVLVADERSPLIHLKLAQARDKRTEEDAILQKICDACIDAEVPVALAKAKYVPSVDKTAPRPSLKIYISAAHSEEQILKGLATLKASIGKIVAGN